MQVLLQAVQGMLQVVVVAGGVAGVVAGNAGDFCMWWLLQVVLNAVLQLMLPVVL